MRVLDRIHPFFGAGEVGWGGVCYCACLIVWEGEGGWGEEGRRGWDDGWERG